MRIGTDDLMLSLLQMRASTALQVLDHLKVDHAEARARLLETPSTPPPSEPVPNISNVHVELSPHAQQLVRRALRIGSIYVARRYASPRLVTGASKAAQIRR